jgi:hypothetical protein
MRFGDPHTLLLLFVYAVLGLSGYFLIICFFCMFLAFGEASDRIRPKSPHKPGKIAGTEDQDSIDQDRAVGYGGSMVPIFRIIHSKKKPTFGSHRLKRQSCVVLVVKR